MGALGLASIDRDDWFGVYGWVPSPKWADDFLKFWDRKQPMSHDWADEHGIDVDLSTPFFKAKDISITGHILADNEADFWNKHLAMFNLLAKPGKRRIYVNELGRSFYVYYDSSTSFDRLTRIKTGQVACKYTLKFIEPVPSFFKQFKYMTDKNGKYILTPEGNKIIVV